MSHIISVKRVAKLAGVSLVALGLGACAQTTRHSNTLLFGTNTSFGLNVGKDASQTPTVQIGFQRQEAAFVPLLANTSVADGDPDKLIPCNIASGSVDGAINSENCMFIAQSMENGEVTNKDAYSVLASFGGSANGGTNVGMTVAQYFATGVAAQQLAESGGANVVTASGQGGKIADAAKATADAKAAKANADKAKYEAKAKEYIKTTVAPSGVTIAAKLDQNNNAIAEQSEIDLLDPHVASAVEVNLDKLAGKPMTELIEELSRLIPLDIATVSKAL